MAHPRGRDPIGIQQGPGQGGDHFPIIGQPSDDIRLLLADAFLAYEDNTNKFSLPFHIDYLFGLGTNSVAVPITPAHSHDAQIVDDEGLVVFDSLSAVDFKITDWDSRLKILEWVDDNDQILRIVYHTEFGPNDDVIIYDDYIEPVRAPLDNRVLYQLPKRLQSVRVGLVTLEDTAIRFKNGFNTTIDVGSTSTTDGALRGTTLTFNAVPNTGAGRFGGCDDVTLPAIRRLNNVGPNERGNFTLDATGCHRIERPVLSQLASGPREVRVRDHALQIFNDCSPRCKCEDFLAVWEALRRLRDRYSNAISRFQSIRDLYTKNKDRFQSNLDCRDRTRLRLVLQPTCPNDLGIGVGYCNNSQECLTNLVIHISFQYTDGTGKCTNEGTKGFGSGPLDAVTTAPFPSLICNSVFRSGNMDQAQKQKTRAVSGTEFYQLGGAYPHYWAYWNAVDPGSLASVMFRLVFDGATSDDQVEVIADAYQLDGPPLVGGSGSPVPGYTPGSGPLSTPEELKLADCPIFGNTGLIPECCPEESVTL